MTTANVASKEVSQREHQLQCMEIWNGNRSIEKNVSSAGIQAWVFSHPYQGNRQGGDIHYMSLCVGGIVTRIILADVAGHGDRVAKTSKALLQLLRRFMNTKKQNQLVAELNRHFTETHENDGFATAVVATYLSHKSTLLLTNAGHPRPLFFNHSHGQWEFLNLPTTSKGLGENYPFGLSQSTRYDHFVLRVDPGDWLVLYTDAYTESSDSKDKLLGESGLLEFVQQIPLSSSLAEFGRKLNQRMQLRSENWLNDDDTTLIAIQFTENTWRPNIFERLVGYLRLLRSSPIIS